MNKPTQNQITEFLTRGVDEVIDREKLEEEITSKQLRVYLGIDPTGADIHIGHAVTLWKLKQLQDWGHHVILLIGDFTAMIGDPTGRDEMRQPLTSEQVLENARDYQKQAEKILDFTGENAIEIKYNSEWLHKLRFGEVIDLAGNFTVQQMLERDMFEKRMEEGLPISLHEFLYPLMQGYDSVVMDIDLELGGSDQLFNMLAGRTLKEKLRGEEKHVMTTQLLEGTDGRKMSKTYNNHIPITAEPTDMYGRVMSMKDDLIEQYFWLATEVEKGEIEKIVKGIKEGANPRDAKMRLAREIVTMYHDEAAAKDAEEAFINQFQKGNVPEEMESFTPASKTMMLVDVLVDSGLCDSKSDARRMIEQGAVKLNEESMTNTEAKVTLNDGDVIQKGKRGFRRVRVA